MPTWIQKQQAERKAVEARKAREKAERAAQGEIGKLADGIDKATGPRASGFATGTKPTPANMAGKKDVVRVPRQWLEGPARNTISDLVNTYTSQGKITVHPADASEGEFLGLTGEWNTINEIRMLKEEIADTAQNSDPISTNDPRTSPQNQPDMYLTPTTLDRYRKLLFPPNEPSNFSGRFEISVPRSLFVQTPQNILGELGKLNLAGEINVNEGDNNTYTIQTMNPRIITQLQSMLLEHDQKVAEIAARSREAIPPDVMARLTKVETPQPLMDVLRIEP